MSFLAAIFIPFHGFPFLNNANVFFVVRYKHELHREISEYITRYISESLLNKEHCRTYTVIKLWNCIAKTNGQNHNFVNDYLICLKQLKLDKFWGQQFCYSYIEKRKRQWFFLTPNLMSLVFSSICRWQLRDFEGSKSWKSFCLSLHSLLIIIVNLLLFRADIKKYQQWENCTEHS